MGEAQESTSGSTKATSSFDNVTNKKHRQASPNKERRLTQTPSKSTAIIPGLPDDVGLSIVARLPRSLQHRCRVICHAWKDAVEAATMGSLRKSLHISEEWPVFFIRRVFPHESIDFRFTIVDPLEWCHCNIPLPQKLEQHQRRGGVSCKVIGAIGGEVLIACVLKHASEEGAELQGVYSFDGLRMKWAESKYSALPNSLSLDLSSNHASAADMVRGYLYVARGFGLGKSVEVVERLDTKTRMWETLPDPHLKRMGAVGFVVQGLYHLIGGWKVNGINCSHGLDRIVYKMQNSGEIWDPVSKQWTLVPELLPREVFGRRFEMERIAALKDRLYALRRVLMTYELMYYESVSKSWISLGCVPFDCEAGKVRLLAVGEELWVIDRSTRACVATKPTFSQPISWKARPCTHRIAPRTQWDYIVAALHV